MPRKILYLDLDAFFYAVEEQRDLPCAIKHSPSAGDLTSWVVASCSYAAHKDEV